MQLRPYQDRAVSKVFVEWEQHRSTLLVMATGTGKTATASEILRRRREHGRILWVAHREELITQAAESLDAHGNLSVEIEKAERKASTGRTLIGSSDVVVASIGSLHKKRRKRFPSDAFATIVIDEAHRSAARTYREVIGYFSRAKVLGLTATPDRGDGVGLGAIFDTVADQYDIRDAIDDGWLVPLRQKQIECADLDISNVKATAGDLAQGELDQAMSVDAVLHQVASPLVSECERRQTIVFCAGVGQAHALADVMAAYVEAGEVAAIDGSTPAALRRMQLERFREGRLRYLLNVGVFTEGTDLPMASCIAVARPTKSRGLYCQMIGRGTRLYPGKSDCLILDFVGNAGRHQLISPIDILGGKQLPEETRKRAQKKAAEGKDVSQAVREAQLEQEEAERRRKQEEDKRRRTAKVKAEVRYSVRELDPFGVTLGADSSGPRATPKQLEALQAMGVKIGKTPSIAEASAMLRERDRRRRNDLCSYRQARQLAQRGLRTDLSKREASQVMAALAQNKWRSTPQWVLDKFGKQQESAA